MDIGLLELVFMPPPFEELQRGAARVGVWQLGHGDLQWDRQRQPIACPHGWHCSMDGWFALLCSSCYNPSGWITCMFQQIP